MTTTAEKSYGGNADIGYKFSIGDKVSVSFNQMLFYTILQNPLTLQKSGIENSFINIDGNTTSRGAETFFKLMFSDFTFFLGYTFTDATTEINGVKSDLTLTPKHSIKGDLLYSLPGKWRIGADYELKGAQMLSSGMYTDSYWTFGAMVEHYYDKFTFFGNVENIFDYRQTSNNKSLVSAPNNTPQFTEVWAPLDGFVFNFGLKIKL
jgi:outer membrane receptor for ferrienterochelin and colicins